jgi:hypothetical protein
MRFTNVFESNLNILFHIHGVQCGEKNCYFDSIMNLMGFCRRGWSPIISFRFYVASNSFNTQAKFVNLF